ncbi:metalloendopeptidase [Plasmodium ovale wallikeri]|uniref:Metalloendopeptidase n=1 Tax=Plasmodium ovale wallikeri TaxID=864142 RepID=A0A1A8ZJL4_PLAOA|nr:metalloendopeptidase [Plasmodium ovale wallikeri]
MRFEDMCELEEDDDLVKCELPNKLSNIIYKKRKNVNKKKYILNNEKYVILPSNKISDAYKNYINPIDYNYEELHVYMEVNTGSVNEKKNQQGISHLCEHISYMGSKNRKDIIDKNIRTNAYTDFHHIVFYISVSLNNEIYKENSMRNFKYDNFVKHVKEEDIENCDIYTVDEFNYKHTILSQCIDTMVEVLTGDTQFNKERIIKEKKAIFSEYSIINTVEYKMNSDIIKTLHRENRLRHRLPIGKLELLKRYEEKDIKEYFDLFFRPENVNLFVYGDVNVDIAQKMISQKFEKVKKKDLTKEEIAYLKILNCNTLRSKNKNLPAVVHTFGSCLTRDSNNDTSSTDVNILPVDESTIDGIKREGLLTKGEEEEREWSANDRNDFPYVDDNIIDGEKLKEMKKNNNEVMSEFMFRSYLKNKYSVNLEEEKSLNKPGFNVKTLFEIINYSLNSVNINILLKGEIKSIRCMEDFKESIMKDVLFYCLSFRFNIHRNDLFNSIDINEYTNINEGATIRTVEIKTTVKFFEKSVAAFYTFVKSLIIHGLSRDELENYKKNEMDFDEEEGRASADATNGTDAANGEDVVDGAQNIKGQTPKNMKLTHPEKEDDEYILDTKINETYTDEIQKIIDYNSCGHVYMNEKRERKMKKKIFEKLKVEEINTFAKNYFEYIFNIFKENTNFKPNCIVIHVPHNHFNNFCKKKVKKLFYDSITSEEDVPNYSLSIQNKLLSAEYIYENVTKRIHMARYVEPKNEYREASIFHYILAKIRQIKKQNILPPMCSLTTLNTVPNFSLFKECYDIGRECAQKDIITPNGHLGERTKKVPHSEMNVNAHADAHADADEEVEIMAESGLTTYGERPLNLRSHVHPLQGQRQVENYQLMNGVKVNIYKTKIDKKNIYLRLIIPHNDILKRKKHNVFVLLFSVICLFEGGEIENVGREHVEIHCSNRSINIYIDVNDECFFIDIYTYNKYENVNSAFSILNNILVQTKIEPSARQRVVDKLKKDYFEYKNNLQSLLMGQTLSHLSDGAVGYQNFDLEEAETISLDIVQDVLKNLFSDLSLFELTIVGDVSNFMHYYILHFVGTLQGSKSSRNVESTSIQDQSVNILSKKRYMKKESTQTYSYDKGDKQKDFANEYNLLCPLQNFEQKSKEITYVYIREKEEHAIFLLIGKSANSFGILSNGVHISIYLLQFLKKLVLNENKTENKQKRDIINLELEKIKKHVNIKSYVEEQFNDFIKKKKKLYTNPLFFGAVSYIIQYILNSKMFHYLREKKELTYDSSFEFINYEKYFAGFFTLLVQTNPRDLDLIKKEVLSSFNEFTKNYYNYSDYLIQNAKLSYLNKKYKDLKYIVDKISGMQLVHFPLKYKNKYLLKDNLILNKIEKLDVLLVLFILFNQMQNYHISYGISAPDDIWKHTHRNINRV